MNTQELEKCKNDPLYFFETYVVKRKASMVEKFYLDIFYTQKQEWEKQKKQ